MKVDWCTSYAIFNEKSLMGDLLISALPSRSLTCPSTMMIQNRAGGSRPSDAGLLINRTRVSLVSYWIRSIPLALNVSRARPRPSFPFWLKSYVLTDREMSRWLGLIIQMHYHGIFGWLTYLSALPSSEDDLQSRGCYGLEDRCARKPLAHARPSDK